MNTENNKIIAEFLGANPFREDFENNIFSYEMYGIIETIDDGEDEQHFFFAYEMLFDSDWNWLMPVVSKCFEYGELNNEYRDQIIASLSGVIDIADTYNACVDFIKWYNEQKQ